MKIEHEIEVSRMVGGDLENRYQIYLDCANDGNGFDITTGKPLKTFEEWLKS
jgi:hypothetical protein